MSPSESCDFGRKCSVVSMRITPSSQWNARPGQEIDLVAAQAGHRAEEEDLELFGLARGKLFFRALEELHHVEGRAVAWRVHLSTLTLRRARVRGFRRRSRIRATVSALKSERARRMKLLTEIRALFSLSGFVAFLLDEGSPPGFDLLRR